MSQLRAPEARAVALQAAQKAPLFDAGNHDPLEVCSNYIGVYWTFPAPGRDALPSDMEEAARASFTVDEQRRRTQRQARVWGLDCVREFAIQFSAYDLSEADHARMDEIKQVCASGETLVILTDFPRFGNWRPNWILDAMLRNTHAPVMRIEPSGAVIDHFSLNRHWEKCRAEIRRATATAKRAVASGKKPKSFRSGKVNKIVAERFYDYLAARLNDIRNVEALGEAEVAGRLNALGLYTLRGHKWDADAVRSLRATLAARSEREARKAEQEAQAAHARRRARAAILEARGH